MQIDDKTRLVLRPMHQQQEWGIETTLMLHTIAQDGLLDETGVPEQHAWIISAEELTAALKGYAVTLNHAVKDPGLVKPTAEAVQAAVRSKQ